ncbi:MAG: DUF3732 domain-containing protein [Pseudomonadota bacterium]|nr:DUF3732 domain-containing protein [Pseudomonadota bacterium]
MYCQIEKVFLFPKDETLEPREITFKVDKVNIIYGASQTGKSAIISVIDWCLASSESRIPVGVVRNTCKAFGLLLNLGDSKVLIKRLSPDEKIKGDTRTFALVPMGINDDVCEFLECEFLDDITSVKDYLNTYVLKIPNVKIKEKDSKRIGFRDTVSLNYQPQNIVANPASFFYKSDENKYRALLSSAFTLILGVETFDNYENKQKLEALLKEEKYLEKVLDRIKGDSLKEYKSINDILHRGVALGISKEEEKNNWIVDVETERDVQELKSQLENLSVNDIINSISLEESISARLLDLQKEDATNTAHHFQKNNDLRYLKQLLTHLSCSDSDILEFESLDIASEMLVLLVKLGDEISVQTQKQLKNISTAYQDKKPHVNSFVKEDIEKNISNLESELRDIYKEGQRIFSEQQALLKVQNRSEKIIQFIVDIKKAVGVRSDKGAPIREDLKLIKEQKKSLDVKDIQALKRDAYSDINKRAQNIIKNLNSEYRQIFFDEGRLSVKFKKEGMTGYFPLSETGSGSNWVSSHIAMTLAIHLYGASNNSRFSSFVIYDQPSQVYYPHKSEGDDGELDTKGVKEVSAMVKAMTDSVKQVSKGLQVILLDHAGEDVWGEHKNDVHLVDGQGWKKNGMSLVPVEWL